jgi:hypothetical protein
MMLIDEEIVVDLNKQIPYEKNSLTRLICHYII